MADTAQHYFFIPVILGSTRRGRQSPKVTAAQGCFCATRMQELNDRSSFRHLPHRQTSYNMPVLSKCLPDPLKKLSLSGILCRVTQHHRALW
jgi:hypothetical protein